MTPSVFIEEARRLIVSLDYYKNNSMVLNIIFYNFNEHVMFSNI